MIHMNHNNSSCLIYKKSDCENYWANKVRARAPATPIKSSERDHLSSNGHQKRVRRVHNIQALFQ